MAAKLGINFGGILIFNHEKLLFVLEELMLDLGEDILI
jgi:hypothetical protein